LKRLDCCVCALPPAKNTNIQDRGRADILLDLAGVANIAAGQPMPWPEITSEWLVEQNPNLIVKVASATFIKNGYGVDDVQAIDAFRNDMIARPAWNQIKALKTGRVHIPASELWVGPRAPIGILYIAKWAYPDRFTDMDPEAIHRIGTGIGIGIGSQSYDGVVFR
jgi:iron complex transport system substrate-binding protein